MPVLLRLHRRRPFAPRLGQRLLVLLHLHAQLLRPPVALVGEAHLVAVLRAGRRRRLRLLALPPQLERLLLTRLPPVRLRRPKLLAVLVQEVVQRRLQRPHGLVFDLARFGRRELREALLLGGDPLLALFLQLLRGLALRRLHLPLPSSHHPRRGVGQGRLLLLQLVDIRFQVAHELLLARQSGARRVAPLGVAFMVVGLQLGEGGGGGAAGRGRHLSPPPPP